MREQTRTTLENNASWLRDHPDAFAQVVGYCDARENDPGLAARRALAVRDFYVRSGVARRRLSAVSRGKEQPLCPELSGPCLLQNRRVETLLAFSEAPDELVYAAPPAASSTAAPPTAAQAIGASAPTLETVTFPYFSDWLGARSRAALRRNAAWLKAHPTRRVELAAGCDQRGTERFNRALGRQRVLAVRSYYIHLGIAPGRLSLVDYGKDRPVCDDSDPACRERNRRVETVLIPSAGAGAPGLARVYFAAGSDWLGTEARALLRENAERLRGRSDLSIEVVADRGPGWPSRLERDLLRVRARKVRDYYVHLGIGKDRLFIRPGGQIYPACAARDEACKRDQRGVETLIIRNGGT